jgi:hypothetical protein
MECLFLKRLKVVSVLILILLHSVITLDLHSQSLTGCYIGAYLGCGSMDSSCISTDEFNTLTGRNHYCFSRYIDAGDDADLLNPANWTWANSLKMFGAKSVFFLMPFGGLITYTNGSRDISLSVFAQSCGDFNELVYIIFGHEMNGFWNPYGGTAQAFVDAFRHVSSLMKSIAPNIIMCWVPLQAWGQNDYNAYYPGDSYTDWVGLNFYDRDYDENNAFFPVQFEAALNYLNFYQDFSVARNKPMMLAENALFDANYDPTIAGVRIPLTYEQQAQQKNQWISSLYNKTTLENIFPYLNMLIYFHVEKYEYDFESQNQYFGNLVADWRIPLDEEFNTYSGIISDPYFIGGIPENREISVVQFSSDEPAKCYDAEHTITIWDVSVEDGASLSLIAGENILMFEHILVEHGGHLHAYITTEGIYCFQFAGMLASEELPWDNSEPIAISEPDYSFLTFYPNPTPGIFTLEIIDASASSDLVVEIFTIMGERILLKELEGSKYHDFDLSEMASGIYLVRVIRGDEMGIEKVIRQ